MARSKEPPRMSQCTKNGEWFHGSPEILSSIRPGSTITGNRILAMAFSHKPDHLHIEVEERDESGLRTITLKQDGTRNGYLYRVILSDPETDTKEDPESVMFPGDEVLTSRELEVELLEEIPLRREYIFSDKKVPSPEYSGKGKE
ncbi:MAG: hypothetical protein KAH31_01270 [Candidatus Sabulitectum sp.]|nr:hypothetical protein [Candidatus Sabulitectum sp.]